MNGPRRGAVTSVLAAVLVFGALVLPDDLIRLPPGAFVRIPVEGTAGAALPLLLPPRPRRTVAVLAGTYRWRSLGPAARPAARAQDAGPADGRLPRPLPDRQRAPVRLRPPGA
ncbi:hypothetical protein ACGF4C_14680 [Streptomyces sp. NPDC048197]|uniref:hypothetical protein n=1 Tax=Streptomyces sp. NPDC048197 TaxID=3365511 RepID=UPI0037150E6C